MARIVHSVKVGDIVGATLADVVTIIGKDHPKMTQRERDMKEAQRRILALFGDMLLESWPTANGPQFMDCVVVQD
jgi:hypothetical protein